MLKKHLFLLCALLIFAFSNLQAQTKFSDTELTLFGKTYDKVRLASPSHFDILMQAVAAEKMEQKRFEEIWAAEMLKKPIPISDTEKAQLENVRNLLLKAQEKQAIETNKIILASGMSLELYNEILAAYRQDSRLQNKIYHLSH
jgi:hypothetical protein